MAVKNQQVPPTHPSEDQSITGGIRTTIKALILHHLENVPFLLEEEKVQMNILLVMNVQYTHQLLNEKQGQLNTFTR